MKSTMRRLIAGVVLLVAVTISVAGLAGGSSASRKISKVQASGQDAKTESHGGKLEGTWRVQVSQRNCQTGVDLRTFPALLTFARGGTLTGTTTAFPPALRGPDHGVWNYNGDRTYRAVTEAFAFNAAGIWVSTQRITQTIQLSSDAESFISDASVEFFDTAGNVSSTGCARAVATRMQ